MQGAALSGLASSISDRISTHAPHARRGFYASTLFIWGSIFLLTRLMQGAARHFRGIKAITGISTHAPHARRGVCDDLGECRNINFYSRASCKARRTGGEYRSRRSKHFYSRASCKARPSRIVSRNYLFYFYSRASCKARRYKNEREVNFMNFYSRASCKARLLLFTVLVFMIRFLLTRLMQGAARSVFHYKLASIISTHAPHARRGQG